MRVKSHLYDWQSCLEKMATDLCQELTDFPGHSVAQQDNPRPPWQGLTPNRGQGAMSWRSSRCLPSSPLHRSFLLPWRRLWPGMWGQAMEAASLTVDSFILKTQCKSQPWPDTIPPRTTFTTLPFPRNSHCPGCCATEVSLVHTDGQPIEIK